MTKSSVQMEDKANWSRQAYTHYVLFSDDLYFQSFGTHFSSDSRDHASGVGLEFPRRGLEERPSCSGNFAHHLLATVHRPLLFPPASCLTQIFFLLALGLEAHTARVPA